MTDTLERVRALVTKHFGELDFEGRPIPPGNDQDLIYSSKEMSSKEHCAKGGYGLDSLDAVELAMAIEEEFGTEVPDDVAASDDFRTIAGIARWIDTQGRKASV